MQSSNEHIAKLSSGILDKFLNSTISKAEFQTMSDGLFKLLKEEDRISESVISLIAHTIQSDLLRYLPEVFCNLTDPASSLYKNTIRLLQILFQQTKQLFSRAPHKNPLRSVHLQCHMLGLLFKNWSTIDLTLRDVVLDLLVHFHPGVLFPSLVEQLYDNNNDPRSRSLVLHILRETLVQHQIILFSLQVVFDSVRHFSKFEFTKIKSPADLPSSVEELATEKLENLARLAFGVLAEWAKSVPEELCKPVVEWILAKVYASPNESFVIKFASQFSEFFANQRGVVFDSVLRRLEEQLKKSANVSGSWEDQTVQGLMFDRLAPLLVLRMMPMSAFRFVDNEEYLEERFGLVQVLQERLFSESEAVEIKRVSAELLARFPPMDYFNDILSVFSTSSGLDLKICLYCFCHGLLLNGDDYIVQSKLDRIHHRLIAILQVQTPASEEEAKLQQGSMDCLSMVIRAGLCADDPKIITQLCESVINQTPFHLKAKFLSGLIKSIESLSITQQHKLAACSIGKFCSFIHYQLSSKQESELIGAIYQVSKFRSPTEKNLTNLSNFFELVYICFAFSHET
jgi:hypothetical protein